MRNALYVAIGAAIGGVARYLLAAFVQERAGLDFPFGTLLINITGSFLLGFLIRITADSAAVTPEFRLLLTTGFCGGYTTFSTFSYETAGQIQRAEYGRAALYVTGSVGLSLIGTFLGFAAANAMLAARAGA
ncbi:MAG TPA: fluoride efflux transporter CrcB [Gemmatimonadaceae bacterium]|nr:fluoride efflux transporter CrcB [Gemmatimonadaceae bacterium]